MPKTKCAIFLLFSFCTILTASAQKQKAPDSVKPAAVYTYVEQMPEPTVDLAKYIKDNLVYPQKALDDNIEGRVMLKFIVNEDGTTTDIQAIRGISKECDEEAIRVLKSMPPWKPGKQNGRAIKVYFTLPIVYRHP